MKGISFIELKLKEIDELKTDHELNKFYILFMIVNIKKKKKILK